MRPARFPTRTALTLGAFAIAAMASFLNASSAPLVGRAYAVDGDTLRLGETRIRLRDIDAPELDQTCSRTNQAGWRCGRQARAFLAGLVADAEISCQGSGRDRYGRTLARCRVGDLDLAEAIVSAGWATAEFAYANKQDEARAARRGIWSGAFETPAQWRRDRGEADANLWDWIRSWFG